jgi:hypothetical protein
MTGEDVSMRSRDRGGETYGRRRGLVAWRARPTARAAHARRETRADKVLARRARPRRSLRRHATPALAAVPG